MSFMSYVLNAVKDDRAYAEMLAAAQERLRGRSAADAAERSGFAWDPRSGCLSCRSLGRDVTVNGSDWSVRGAMGNWHSLTILHCLDMADGSPVLDELISFGQQADALSRGGDFDRRSESTLSRALGRLDPAETQARCLRLGAVLLPSNADICARFFYLPRYPITLKLWFADEDLEGSARLFLDRSCGHYLSIEDSVVVGTILMEELQRA